MNNQSIRVLIAKPGLDGHDVGAKVICRALMDAGMEVTYTGLRQSPEAIASAAVENNVEVIGLSILCGSHMPLSRKIVDELQRQGVGKDVLLVVGGNIPAADRPLLQEMGIAEVFPTSTPMDDVVQFIQKEVAR